jgi:hypothetical protein
MWCQWLRVFCVQCPRAFTDACCPIRNTGRGHAHACTLPLPPTPPSRRFGKLGLFLAKKIREQPELGLEIAFVWNRSADKIPEE